MYLSAWRYIIGKATIFTGNVNSLYTRNVNSLYTRLLESLVVVPKIGYKFKLAYTGSEPEIQNSFHTECYEASPNDSRNVLSSLILIELHQN